MSNYRQTQRQCTRLLLSDIKSAVIVCIFVSDPVIFTDISATVTPNGVKFCIMVDSLSVPDTKSPLFRVGPQGIPKSQILGLNFGHLTII